MKNVVLLFISWFLIINVYALISNNRVNLAADTSQSWINEEQTHQVQSWNPNSLHDRWDSYSYLTIAERGYSYSKNELSNVVFFPLYPLLIRLISYYPLINFRLAGWLISTISTLLSCIYLYKLVAKYHKESNPLTSVFLMLIFPTAVFLNGIYTEALFLFLSISAFYYFFEKKYFTSGIFGFFAALTRFAGIMIAVSLFVEYIIEYRKEAINRNLLSFSLVPAGVLLFFSYYLAKFGDFFLLFRAEAAWGRSLLANIGYVYLETNPAISNFILDVGFVTFAIFVAIFVYKRFKKPSYPIYIIGSLFLPLSSGSLNSIGRYIFILFPIYILGASIKNKVLLYAWIITSNLFLGLYTLLYSAHYWAG